MFWLDQFGTWLLHSAVFGSLILAAGGCAVCLCREPLYRTRIIHWTFVACLLVPLLQQVEIIPGYSLNVWQEPAAEPLAGTAAGTHTPPAPADAENSATTPGSAPLLEFAAQADQAEPARYPTAPAPTETAQRAVGTTGIAGSAATGAWKPLPLPSLLQALQAVYFAIIGYWLLAWLVGLVCRWSIARMATPADQGVRDVLMSIAGPRGGQTRLLVSERIASPVMWGLWRPTIVLPSHLVSALDSEELRWGLAHEWSHVVHGDFAALMAARISKLVCFYQPVYWWLRRQLMLSQDYVADAFAAEHGRSAEDYAAFLVSLARVRSQPMLAGTLGIGSHHSNLVRRVKMLVQSARPLVQHDRLVPAMSIVLIALLTVGGLSIVRLSAEPLAEQSSPSRQSEGDAGDAEEKDTARAQAADRQGPQDKTKDKPGKDAPDPITYTGKVVDRESGKPIAGATVEVTHEFSRDPETGKWKTLHTTTHTSDESGEYSFTLPREEVAEPSLYLVVDAHHPQYQSKGRSGYSHMMIQKNLAHGEPPFFATIQLSPAEPVSSVVLQPDGKPSAGTHVMAYSKPPTAEPGRSFERGAFQQARTDENGRFQLPIATPGDGVLWVFPKEYSPLAYRIGDKRGDLGPLKLQEGMRLAGRVLDAQGEPVPNVAVNLRRRGDGEEADEFLNMNAVANGIAAGSKTDHEGRFQLNPLPPGTYRAEVSERVSDPTAARERGEELEVEDVFVPLEITINEDMPLEPIEIRAVPHVIIRGRFFNSQGKPRASHEQHLFAKTNGGYFSARSTTPGNDGWFEFKVPHGAEDVRVNLITNEHSALRWRLKPDEPLTYGREVSLGTLEEDFTTLEVVRYAAPMLLLKAVDEAGNQVMDFTPRSNYEPRLAKEDGSRFISGALGDVGFEKQPDGRWRSNQLLPDEKLTVTLEKDGYTTEAQTVELEEGDVRELVFTLKKAE